jgi:crotonobetainyl-CoA:carnitine CoA-transferase CaiB-like acyl-CoA transferase
VTAVMPAIHVLEVAEHTFVPAASAILSDGGADAIKLEHVERGDAMGGVMAIGGLSAR